MRPTLILATLLVLTTPAFAVGRHLAATAQKATVRGKPGARITIPLITDSPSMSVAACGVVCPTKLAAFSDQDRSRLDTALVQQSGKVRLPRLNVAVPHTIEVQYAEHGLASGQTVNVVSTWPNVMGSFHVWGQTAQDTLVLP